MKAGIKQYTWTVKTADSLEKCNEGGQLSVWQPYWIKHVHTAGNWCLKYKYKEHYRINMFDCQK